MNARPIAGVPASAPILGYRVDASYFQKWESIPKPLRHKAIALVAASCVPASDEVAALRETVATLTQVILERNAEINRLVGRERYSTSGVNAVAAPLVDWPAIHRGFASAAPAVEAAATRINEAAEALMANHFGGLGLRGPNVNDPPTYPRPPAPPRPPGVGVADSKTQAPKGPNHG